MTELLDHHHELLKASAITDQVIALRGYWSAQRAAELERLGYRRNTVNAPALVLPMWGVRGEPVGYQIRPDVPPVIDSKIAKYLSPPGAGVRLDIPPACRNLIGSPQVPLWITEGVKKGDSLASIGLTAVALAGVQMFRTDDWDLVPLADRRVFIVFDSDVMVKAPVHAALVALRSYLSARGADLMFAYLPTDNGKVGVDDFLANGGTVEELYALATDELREPPPEPRPKRTAALPTAYLLDVIEALFRRFVRFSSKHEPTVLALFTLHTHALSAARATPYLLVISPEKRSGKTRVLEVLELAVREPIRASNISAAGVFQAVEKWQPTLLIDEIDTIFIAKSEAAEALRGAIGGGNRPGSFVIRGTQDGEPARFETYCPKVLAGINTGKLPDTIRDRSIVITMKRRHSGETIDDLFPAELAEQLAELRRRLSDWAAENVNTLAAWRRPARVQGLDDRLQEAWDSLLAIADLAQAGWPEKARAAATALAKGAEDAGEAAHGHVVIETLRTIFGIEPAHSSQAICSKLNADEELPFAAYSAGTGIKPRDLARLLKPYGIRSRVVRTGTDTAKGYRRDQFADVWARYAPGGGARTDPSEEGSQGSQGSHPNAHGAGDVTPVTPVTPLDTGPCAHTPPDHERRPSTIDYDLLRDGAGPTAGADSRPVAEFSDDELLAVFPGATIKAARPTPEPSPGTDAIRRVEEDARRMWSPELRELLNAPGGDPECSPCDCHQRTREWRLRGEALDVVITYVSNKAHTEAVGQGRDVIPKGKRSGWVVERTPSELGHPWTCGLCHPPAEGLEVEWRDVELDGQEVRHPGSRLRWRIDYGWRRDGEPDGDPLPTRDVSDEAFLRKVGGGRLVREWQLRAQQEAARAGEAEPAVLRSTPTASNAGEETDE